VNGVQGRASANKAKKCSKNLSRCRSRDIENGFDREDVLWRARGRWRKSELDCQSEIGLGKSRACFSLTSPSRIAWIPDLADY
jgi:hypothetical protein